MEISKLRNLKRMEIEGEKESKSIPFQPATSFVTNGTSSLEILNSEARCVSEDPYLQSTLQWSRKWRLVRDGWKEKKVIGDREVWLKSSEWSTKTSWSLWRWERVHLCIWERVHLCISILTSWRTIPSRWMRMWLPELNMHLLPIFLLRREGVVMRNLTSLEEVVMRNLTSLEEASFGKGWFPNVSVMSMNDLSVVKNITLKEGSFGKAKELVVVSKWRKSGLMTRHWKWKWWCDRDC